MENAEKFMPYQAEVDIEELLSQSEGYWKTSVRILLGNKAGMAALILLLTVMAMCIFGEYLRPFGVQEQNTALKNQSPSSVYWFGTDQLGRDLFVRVCHGGRISLEIGLIAAVTVSLIGVVYGSVSGYLGGRTDLVMMRVVEVFKGVPHLVIVILLSILLDVQGILPLLIALTISGWVNTAQIIRGQVKQIKNREFVLAARCLGIPAWKIILKHMIPNMAGIISVTITLDIPAFIFEEAFLSFIGLGLKNPAISWGILISLGQVNLIHEPYQAAFPAIAISVTMIAFNILGNALKDAFDPKMRRQVAA